MKLVRVAWIVGIPHSADGDLRRLIHFDGLELRYPFKPLLHGGLGSHLLYLGEQVVRERHASLRRPDLQRPVQLVGHVADLDHLRHVDQSNTCSAHVNSAVARVGFALSEREACRTLASLMEAWMHK